MGQLKIRLLTSSDLVFADTLRAAVGWNQTISDWERFLSCEPDGCFIAEWDGSPAGTATTTRYGKELGWIGMLLVHPDHRRRGIGKALLHHCLDYLRDSGVRCTKLDATPLGRPLYEQLGFLPEWPLARWATLSIQPIGAGASSGVRSWQHGDLRQILELDEKAFVVSRQTLLSALKNQSCSALVHTLPQGELSGYGMLRPGVRALYLGPVVATSCEAATEIIHALLATVPGQPVFWDIPDSNGEARSLAERLGFAQQRPLFRMFRGENTIAGDPSLFYGIADPAVG